MIEEHARIVAIEAETTWVETQRQTTCGSCSAKNACGSSLLERFTGQRHSRLAVTTVPGLGLGDEVILGLEESSLLQGSFAVYMLPLLSLLLFAALSENLLADKWMATETAAILGGVVGFMLGLYWLKGYAKRALIDARFRPVILRRVADPAPKQSVTKLTLE
ncbi:SoxR reducing system RseC family protein [Sulfuriflexus mobilis]|uniref:SoxR reducing system RseC family protein n=1 Tax=Sulfuriflexus mobilis TaxID=1811807 RepID=UPI000F828E22|nr:SoxR reducing system RseC family protein [Sulfuriflexus mobilis]